MKTWEEIKKEREKENRRIVDPTKSVVEKGNVLTSPKTWQQIKEGRLGSSETIEGISRFKREYTGEDTAASVMADRIKPYEERIKDIPKADYKIIEEAIKQGDRTSDYYMGGTYDRPTSTPTITPREPREPEPSIIGSFDKPITTPTITEAKPQKPVESWKLSLLANKRFEEGRKARLGQPNEYDKINEEYQIMAQEVGEVGILGQTVAMLPYMGATIGAGVKGGLEASIAAGGMTVLAGQLGPQALIPEEGITVPVAMATGYHAGSITATALKSFELMSGQSYGDLIDMGVDHETAASISDVVGALNAGIELVQLNQIMKPFMKGFNANAATLVRSQLNNKGKSALMGYVKSLGAETLEEVMQEVVSIYGEKKGLESMGQDARWTKADTGRVFETGKASVGPLGIIQGITGLGGKVITPKSYVGKPTPSEIVSPKVEPIIKKEEKLEPEVIKDLVVDEIIPEKVETIIKKIKDTKVVDDENKPKIVYRGTISETIEGEQLGTYFSDSPEIAEMYAEEVDWLEKEEATVHEVMLDIKKPFELDAKGSLWNELSLSDILDKGVDIENLEKKQISDMMGSLNYSKEEAIAKIKINNNTSIQSIAEYAKANGFDGLIINNVRDGNNEKSLKTPSTTYAVFEQEQISSVKTTPKISLMEEKTKVDQEPKVEPTKPSVVETKEVKPVVSVVEEEKVITAEPSIKKDIKQNSFTKLADKYIGATAQIEADEQALRGEEFAIDYLEPVYDEIDRRVNKADISSEDANSFYNKLVDRLGKTEADNVMFETGLYEFTKVEKSIVKEAEKPTLVNNRDNMSFVRDEEPFTITRGKEYNYKGTTVKENVVKIIGISHAKNQVKYIVRGKKGEFWVDKGFIYPQVVDKVVEKPKDATKLSSVVEAENKKQEAKMKKDLEKKKVKFEKGLDLRLKFRTDKLSLTDGEYKQYKEFVKSELNRSDELISRDVVAYKDELKYKIDQAMESKKSREESFSKQKKEREQKSDDEVYKNISLIDKIKSFGYKLDETKKEFVYTKGENVISVSLPGRGNLSSMNKHIEEVVIPMIEKFEKTKDKTLTAKWGETYTVKAIKYNGIKTIDSDGEIASFSYKDFNETLNEAKKETKPKVEKKAETKPKTYANEYKEKVNNIQELSAWSSKDVKNKYKVNGTGKIKSVNEIMMDIRKSFKVGISSTRYRSKKAYAHYKVFPGVIESKIVNTIEPLMHELGHHLDHRYNFSKNNEVLVDAMVDNMPEDFKTMYKKNELRGEAIAEFLRIYMTSPLDVDDFAGEFVNVFESTLEDAKELKKLLAIKNDILGWLDASFEEQFNSTLVTRLDNAFLKSIKRDFKGNVDMAIKKDYMFLFNELQPLQDLAKYSEELSGKPLTVAENPYFLADASLNSPMVAQAITVDQMVNPKGDVIGNSFKSVVGKIDVKEYDAFSNYLVAKRAIDYYARGKRAFSDDLPISYVQKMIEKYESEKPHFETTANELYDWWQTFTKAWVVDTGLMTNELYNKMKELEPHYVPFFRQKDESVLLGDVVRDLAKKGYTDLRNPIKRSSGEGSADPIFYPIESMIIEIERYVTTVKRREVMLSIHEIYNNLLKTGTEATMEQGIGTIINRVSPKMMPESVTMKDKKMNLIFNLYDEFTNTLNKEDKAEYESLKKDVKKGDALIEELYDFFHERGFDASEVVNASIDDVEMEFKPLEFDKESNIITVKGKDGKTYHYEIFDRFLLEALVKMDNSNMDSATKHVIAFRRVVQSLITTFNPVFVAFNVSRDAFHGFVASNIPMHKYHAELFKALYQEVTNGEWSKSYRRSGGGYASPTGADRNALKESMSKVIPGWKRKHKLEAVLQSIEKISDALEQGPRIAEYTYIVKMKGDTFEGRLEALYGGKDVTVNFQRKGQIMRRWYGNFVPFLNPALQGVDKIARMHTKEQIAKTAIRGIVNLTTLSLILYGVHRDDDEYKKVSTYIKDNYYLLPTDTPGVYHKIPKPRELGYIYSSTFERALDSFIDKNPGAWDDYFTNLVNVFMPPKESIFKGFTDALNNRTWYGGNIVPYAYQALQVDQQYTNTTSKFSRMIAKIIPDNTNLSSPMIIDYILKQYTGVIGKLAIPMTDDIKGNALGYVKQAFTTDVAYSNNDVRKFYDRLDSMKSIVATAKFGREFKGINEMKAYELYQIAYDSIKELSAIYEQIDKMSDKDYAKVTKDLEVIGMSRDDVKRLIKLEILNVAEFSNKQYDEYIK